MKTVQEYWDLADRVATRVRQNSRFNMLVFWEDCNTPACLAGETCALVGAEAMPEGGVRHEGRYLGTWQLAQEILGLGGDGPAGSSKVFYTDFWDQESREEYFDKGAVRDIKGMQEVAIRELYKAVEKAHGPRPIDVPSYEVPDWRKVVREIQLEEAGCITQG